MAIFPFKKQEKQELLTPDNEFLVSQEGEGVKEETTQEKTSQGFISEKEKQKETFEKEGPNKEQPSTFVPATTKENKNIPSSTPSVKSPVVLELEQILSENLDDLYASLTPEQKIVFKQKGEETASKIEVLMKEFKVNFDKILTLIKEWLLLLAQMIPGVNKIFLIKEAKIKTEKILFLRNKEKK